MENQIFNFIYCNFRLWFFFLNWKFCKNIKSHVDIKIQLIHITYVEQDFNKWNKLKFSHNIFSTGRKGGGINAQFDECKTFQTLPSYNETETVILVKLFKYLLTFLAVKGGPF